LVVSILNVIGLEVHKPQEAITVLNHHLCGVDFQQFKWHLVFFIMTGVYPFFVRGQHSSGFLGVHIPCVVTFFTVEGVHLECPFASPHLPHFLEGPNRSVYSQSSIQ